MFCTYFADIKMSDWVLTETLFMMMVMYNCVCIYYIYVYVDLQSTSKVVSKFSLTYYYCS